VLSQLAQVGIASRPFISVEIGAPAPVVARTAARRGAGLIVVGRGRHSAIDRMLADETALRLMQTARVPVLSVPESYTGLPRRALAAIDFTSYSIDAARSASALLEPGSELHLVHVSADHGHHGLGTWRHADFGAAVQQEMRARLEATAEEIARGAPASPSVDIFWKDGRCRRCCGWRRRSTPTSSPPERTATGSSAGC
jgi:hypothetical protein